jgi:hypothetical protein
MTRFAQITLVELFYKSFGVGQVPERFLSAEVLGVFVAFPFNTILQNTLPQSAVCDSKDFVFIRFIFIGFILVRFVDQVRVGHSLGSDLKSEIIYHGLEQTGIFTHQLFP